MAAIWTGLAAGGDQFRYGLLRNARLLWALLLLLSLGAPSSASAQESGATLIPYGDGGYGYEVVPHGDLPGFPTSFDPNGFDSGTAPFSNGGCGFAQATNWPADTDLLAVRNVEIPAGASGISVSVGIDNDIVVYWDGTQIGADTHEGCASNDSFTYEVPEALAQPGPHQVAFRAIDRGSATYFDATVRAAEGEPGLLAFGDSIAAGYGLGPSGPAAGGPANENADAYPAVLAGELFLSSNNLAVEGATAAGVFSQICQSAGGTVSGDTCDGATSPASQLPKLITLTVGADDVKFAECITDFFMNNLRPDNPCVGNSLATNLRTLRTDLEDDFRLLSQLYPGVPIVLTGYFNPLGDARLLPDGCPVVTGAVAGPLVVHGDWRQLVDYLGTYAVRQHRGLGPPPQNRVANARLSALAKQVVGRLKDTLSTAAAVTNPTTGQPYAIFAPLDIGTRGICDPSPLVFEPIMQASFELTGPISAGPISLDFGEENRCEGPKDPFEASNTFGPRSGDIVVAAVQHLDYSFYFAPNCVPHPTQEGQQLLASEVRTVLPQSIG